MAETHENNTKDPNLEEAREHFHAARKEMHASLEALIPSGFRDRRRAARKEFLLGVRKLIDVAIDHAETKLEK